MLIAVLGYSLRFPGGLRTADAFWDSLMDQKVGIQPIINDRWNHSSMFHPDPETPSKTNVRYAGMIDGIEQFDAGFFGLSTRESNQLDPQQRLALELAYEAAEHGGVRLDRLTRDRTGVFIGASMTEYGAMAYGRPEAVDRYSNTGGALSIIANRVSHVFNFSGPSLAVDTACSSTIVALHQACQALSAGECDFAISGGVNALLSVGPFIGFSKAGMMSPTGRCHVFSDKADGYVRSEGGGLLLLRPLDKALADGDEIHGVIRTTAVNNDGHTQGIALPNGAAQARLIETALNRAELDADQICYVEAHGTGTQAGDAMECASIGAAIGTRRRGPPPCPIGSVKGHLGHLEPAAGMPGLIKSMEILKRGVVAPTVVTPPLNSRIDFDALNLRVVTEPEPLAPAGGVACIGVNSFGFGGTNAHAVLQSSPTRAKQAGHAAVGGRRPYLVVSARSAAALQQLAGEYQRALDAAPPGTADRLPNASVHRRTWHAHRLVISSRAPRDACPVLAQVAATGTAPKPADTAPDGVVAHLDVAVEPTKPPALVFNGNGALWDGMGQGLYRGSPAARDAIAEMDGLWRRIDDWPMTQYFEGQSSGIDLRRADVGQPLLFATQVAIARHLGEQGIRFGATVGHSVGEVAASYIAGALSLEDALQVIAARGRTQRRLHGAGGMVAIAAAADDLEVLLPSLAPGVVIACRNSPRSTTLAGPADTLAESANALKAAGFAVQILDVPYPFHTAQMDPICDDLMRLLATLSPRDGEIPFYSTVVGDRAAGRELDQAYWWRNVRDPVRFEEAIRSLRRDGHGVFIEVGPSSILRAAIRESARKVDKSCAVVPTLNKNRDDIRDLDVAIPRIVVAGGLTAWEPAPDGAATAGAALPRYPWQYRRHWFNLPQRSVGAYRLHRCHPLLGDPMDLGSAVWEIDVEPQTLAFIDQHRFRDRPTLPAAAYLEMAVAATLRATSPQQPGPAALVRIDGLEIHRGLSFEPGEVHALRTEVDASNGQGTISSRPAQLAAWTPHCTFFGELQSVGRLTAPLTWAEAQNRCGTDRRVEEIYEDLEKKELTYGPLMRPITRTATAIDEAIIELDPDHCSVDPVNGHACHIDPGMIDACLQAVVAAMDARRDEFSDAPRLPYRIGRFRFDPEAGRPRSAHIQVLQATDAVVNFAIAAYGADDRVVFTMEDSVFVAVPQTRKPALDLLDAQVELLDDGRALDGRAAPAVELNGDGDAAVLASPTAGPGGTARAALRDRLLQASLSAVITARIGDDTGQFRLADLTDIGFVDPPTAAVLTAALDLVASRIEDDAEAVAEPVWAVNPDGSDSPTQIWQRGLRDHPDAWGQLALAWQSSSLIASVLDQTLTLEGARAQLRATLAWEAALLRGAEPRLLTETVARLVCRLGAAATKDDEVRVAEMWSVSQALATSLAGALPADRTRYWYITRDARAATQAKALAAGNPRFVPLLQDQVAELPPNEQPRNLDALVVFADALHPDTADELGRFARQWIREGGHVIVAQPDLDPLTRILLAGGTAHGPNGRLSTSSELDRVLPSATWATTTLAVRDGCGAVTIATRTGRLPPLLPVPTNNDGAATATALVFHGSDDDDLATACSAAARKLGSEVVSTSLADADPDAVGAVLDQLAFETSPTRLGLVVDVGGFADAPPDLAAVEVLRVVVQHLTSDVWRTRPALTVVLRNSAATADAAAQNAVDCAIAGFVRVVCNEHPEIGCRIVRATTRTTEGQVATRLADILVQGAWSKEAEVTIDGERVCGLRFARARSGTSGKPAHEPVRYALRHLPSARTDRLAWDAAAEQTPGPGEIEAEVQATACNFRDVMLALGLLPAEALDKGFAGPTLGLEFGGRVTRVGPDVDHITPGDRVVGVARHSFASHVVTPANAVFRVPDGQDPIALSTMPTVFMTALYAFLDLARLEPGESVYIPSAAGGVGLAAIQVARHLGADVYVSAGSAEKREMLRLLGLRQVFDSRAADCLDQVRAATGGVGVDVVLNSVAGSAIRKAVDLLKPFGRFVELGKRDIYGNGALKLRGLAENISFFGVDVDQLWHGRPRTASRLMHALADGIAQGAYHPLPYIAFSCEAVSEAFAALQRARHIGKILVTHDTAPKQIAAASDKPSPAPARLTLRKDAVYLVTGGTAGFGLATARRLAERGAGHVALVSRRGPATPGAEDARLQLEALGATVSLHAADVADTEAVVALVDELADTRGPLAGVVHAAAVFEDTLIADLSAEKLSSALRPKALGAWSLHTATQNRTLDFFVLYSSIAVAIGNVGQANYAAANGFLDGLATYRRARGLPGLSIGWGAIADTGFLARDERLRRLLEQRVGSAGMTSEEALDWLERLISDGSDGGIVAAADWTRIAETSTLVRTNAYQALVGSDSIAPTGQTTISELARSLKDDELKETIADMLVSEIARVALEDEAAIDRNKSTLDLGFDSLLMVELAMAVERRLGARVPPSLLANGPSVDDLAALLVDLLRSRGPDVSGHDDDGLSVMRDVARSSGADRQSAGAE